MAMLRLLPLLLLLLAWASAPGAAVANPAFYGEGFGTMTFTKDGVACTQSIHVQFSYTPDDEVESYAANLVAADAGLCQVGPTLYPVLTWLDGGDVPQCASSNDLRRIDCDDGHYLRITVRPSALFSNQASFTLEKQPDASGIHILATAELTRILPSPL
jgi:hypothetical protein